jgi:hypothetical protein
VPRLLHKAEYLRRGERITLAQSKLAADNKRNRDRTAQLKEELTQAEFDARNVAGVSQLCRLPYFDIVDQSLYDMMHLTAGLVGRNCVQLLKGNRGTGAHRPMGGQPPDLGRKPPLPEEWRWKNKPSVTQRRERAQMTKKYDEWSEAGEKLQKWDAEQRLQEFEKRFGTMSPAVIASMDEAYTRVQAPFNIAPEAKSPFRLSGDMTAYHWLNFTKVYGKYLFLQRYREKIDAFPFDGRHRIVPEGEIPPQPNHTLDGLCQLMDVLTSCLASNATAATKVRTDELVKKFAVHFDEMLPVTEKVVNMHNLIFHIPAMIKRWGPARGFWCFPFERSVRRSRRERHCEGSSHAYES